MMSLSTVVRKLRQFPALNLLATRIYNIYGAKIQNKGKNNLLLYNGSFLNQTKIIIKGSNNKIIIGKNSKLINCYFRIYGDNHTLEIGENCIFSKTNISLTQNEGSIFIGRHTTINGAYMLSGESKTINIGEDCMLSSQIDIRTSDSHSIISLDDNNRENLAKDVRIGKHVWIGNGCKVWKGADVGDGSIIGASSIVTKKIKENSVAVGSPAKVIKKNVTWDRKLL